MIRRTAPAHFLLPRMFSSRCLQRIAFSWVLAGIIIPSIGYTENVTPPAAHCSELPSCAAFGPQTPDCSYQPIIATPQFPNCGGPEVWVDTTHDNGQQITPESQQQPGRFWGFASLLSADGWQVRDSSYPLASLEPGAGPDVLVIANAKASDSNVPAMTSEEVTALVTWLRAGGALLLIFDHPPYGAVGNLLDPMGLALKPPGVDTHARSYFERGNGTLASDGFIVNGDSADQRIEEVTSFRGSSFTTKPSVPDDVTHHALMTFAPGTRAKVDRFELTIGGRLQGMQLQMGRGRIVVVAEATVFTTQVAAHGEPAGMHQTPQNEQFVLNIMRWLAGA